jgi:hypothetical protein
VKVENHLEQYHNRFVSIPNQPIQKTAKIAINEAG